jgi:hypothetical protein
MCYIEGGIPEGTATNYEGCTDKTPPRDDRKIVIPHELYFSKSSPIWEDKGVAFIKSKPNENAKTLGRMYLITAEQFEQVVRQENGRGVDDTSLSVDIIKTKGERELILDAALWYGRIVYLGDEDGYPILTFTGPWGNDEIIKEKPGEKYLNIIRKGIKEIYEISDDEITKYFVDRTG